MAPKMNKKCNNVVNSIFSLQTGIGKNSVYRKRSQIMKELLTSPTREFQQAYKVSQNGPSMFTLLHCGRLFVQGRENVKSYPAFFNGNPDKKPTVLNTFPVMSQCKDLVVWSPDSALSTSTLLKNNARHSTSFLYLTSNKYLIRRCALTGKECESVFLSPRTAFTELQCDPETDTLVLKSIKGSDPERFLTFVVFTSPPLQFSAMFHFSKLIFGKDVIDAGIQQSILFVRHASNRLRLYSMEQILMEFTVNHYNLGDIVDGEVIGQSPKGLPITVNITKQPPVLQEFKSYQGDVNVGGNPWHCLINHGQSFREIINLEGDVKLNEIIATPNSYCEIEHVFFHPDDSSRIIHTSNDFIKISEIRSPHLVPWLNVLSTDFTGDESNKHLNSYVNRYGRRFKPRFTNPGSSTDMCLTYDSESDLLAIMHCSEHHLSNNHLINEVRLYDNITGAILKSAKFDKLEVKTPLDVSSCSITTEGPNFMVVSRHLTKVTGFLFVLTECFPESASTQISTTIKTY